VSCRLCGLARGGVERGGWPWGRLPVPTPMEGWRDQRGTGNRLVSGRCAPGSGFWPCSSAPEPAGGLDDCAWRAFVLFWLTSLRGV